MLKLSQHPHLAQRIASVFSLHKFFPPYWQEAAQLAAKQSKEGPPPLPTERQCSLDPARPSDFIRPQIPPSPTGGFKRPADPEELISTAFIQSSCTELINWPNIRSPSLPMHTDSDQGNGGGGFQLQRKQGCSDPAEKFFPPVLKFKHNPALPRHKQENHRKP